MYSESDDRVATLVLNRPEVLNCANEQWARDLNTLIDDVSSNDRIRAVVLRGAGRAFCSGIDLTALAAGDTSMSFFRNWETALRKIEAMDPVVIAAIHSHCIGGGLQVALRLRSANRTRRCAIRDYGGPRRHHSRDWHVARRALCRPRTGETPGARGRCR